MISEGIRQIITIAEKYPAISRVGVFGSYARGEQTPESDIDILFDYNAVGDYDLDVLDYGEELAQGFGRLNIDFDYVSYRGVVKSKDSATRRDILQDVVWIYEN